MPWWSTKRAVLVSRSTIRSNHGGYHLHFLGKFSLSTVGLWRITIQRHCKLDMEMSESNLLWTKLFRGGQRVILGFHQEDRSMHPEMSCRQVLFS